MLGLIKVYPLALLFGCCGGVLVPVVSLVLGTRLVSECGVLRRIMCHLSSYPRQLVSPVAATSFCVAAVDRINACVGLGLGDPAIKRASDWVWETQQLVQQFLNAGSDKSVRLGFVVGVFLY